MASKYYGAFAKTSAHGCCLLSSLLHPMKKAQEFFEVAQWYLSHRCYAAIAALNKAKTDATPTDKGVGYERRCGHQGSGSAVD